MLGLDIATKIAALYWVPPLSFSPYPFGGIPIFSVSGITFSLNYTVNSGAACGIFAGHSGLLFGFRALIILALVLFVPKHFPIWLIIAGAVGNAIDYCLYGHVIDFFHFTFWGYSFPIFNIADSCITVGVLSLLFLTRKIKEAQTL